MSKSNCDPQIESLLIWSGFWNHKINYYKVFKAKLNSDSLSSDVDWFLNLKSRVLCVTCKKIALESSFWFVISLFALTKSPIISVHLWCPVKVKNQITTHPDSMSDSAGIFLSYGCHESSWWREVNAVERQPKWAGCEFHSLTNESLFKMHLLFISSSWQEKSLIKNLFWWQILKRWSKEGKKLMMKSW